MRGRRSSLYLCPGEAPPRLPRLHGSSAHSFRLLSRVALAVKNCQPSSCLTQV